MNQPVSQFASGNTAPNPVKVIFPIAEAAPLVKVGGLGDVGGSLPLALSRLSARQLGGNFLDIRLILPFHSILKDKIKDYSMLTSFTIPVGAKNLKASVFQTQPDAIPVYLIDGKPIVEAPGVYGGTPQQLVEKYTFFSLAALYFIQQQGWKIDIIHAHDWHSSLCLYGIDTLFKNSKSFKNTMKVLSVHNLPYLGEHGSEIVKKYNFPPATDEAMPEWSRLLPLPLGLNAADRIVAVSPTYASEILTPEFGSGLEEYLKTRAEKISGILNGIDYDFWNPESDGEIFQQFSNQTLEKRILNKKDLLREFNLNPDDRIPLMTIIGRLDYQKGIDLAIRAFNRLADLPWQVIILGTGNTELERAAAELEQKFPHKVRAALRFDSSLSRRLYAGADMLLMPSRYEPCGLAQMIAMRYGCIPIGRATGGLNDTILDYSKGSDLATGFLFEEASVSGLADAMVNAFQHYQNGQTWTQMQINGMNKDFSWDKSSYQYAKIYLQRGGAE